MRQPNEDIGPVPELEAEIFSLAIENIEAEGVADLVVQAVLERCKSFRGFPRLSHNKKMKSADDLLQENDGYRRRFLEALLPSLNSDNLHGLMHHLPVLNQKDLQWFINRIVDGVSPSPEVEANLIWRLASWDYEPLLLIWNACRANPIINELCKGLFEPAPLDSEAAKFQK
jgi:hypothetical protein